MDLWNPENERREKELGRKGERGVLQKEKANWARRRDGVDFSGNN